jgi:hypothetical protein
MQTFQRAAMTGLAALMLLAPGCAGPKGDSPHGLMWYRPPPREPGKPQSVCVAVHGGALQVDRTVPLSEATNWDEPGFATGRLGRTATITSSAASPPTTEAPWAASTAVRSSEGTLAPRVGGTISEAGSWDERPTMPEVGPPGCCSGLLAPLAPR